MITERKSLFLIVLSLLIVGTLADLVTLSETIQNLYDNSLENFRPSIVTRGNPDRPTFPEPVVNISLPRYCQADLRGEEEVKRIKQRKKKGYSLVQSQIVFRHGDRSPLSRLMTPVYTNTFAWECNVPRVSENVRKENKKYQHNRLAFEKYIPNRRGSFGNCPLGFLTERGITQLTALGAKFRRMYVDEAQMLPAEWNTEKLYMRSGDIPRLIQSLQAFLTGFYPPSPELQEVYDINLVQDQDDNLSPSFVMNFCPKAFLLVKEVGGSTEFSSILRQKNAVVRELNTLFKTKISLPNFADVIRSLDCHGEETTFDGLLEEELRNTILDLTSTEFTFFFENPELNRLMIGTLLWEIVNEIEIVVQGQKSFKLGLYSGHDSTLAPLLIMLNIFDEELPPYASYLTFELWEKDSDFFVEILFNGKSRTQVTPGCANQELCLFSSFLHGISDKIYTFNQLDQECFS